MLNILELALNTTNSMMSVSKPLLETGKLKLLLAFPANSSESKFELAKNKMATTKTFLNNLTLFQNNTSIKNILIKPLRLSHLVDKYIYAD